MEDFEARALRQAAYKHSHWFWYVHDIYHLAPWISAASWVLVHLNSLHKNIQLTMEIEKDGHLASLGIDIYKKADGSLGHKIY